MVRLGYHTISDDCVTSAYLTDEEASERIFDLLYTFPCDVDHVWLRDEAGKITWEWKYENH